jgi:hypothetical protein
MSEGKPMEDRGPPLRQSIAKCGHMADVDWSIPAKLLFECDLLEIAP